MTSAALSMPDPSGRPALPADASAPAGGPGVCPRELSAIRGDMLRFAQLQLGHHDVAEDLVQESIEAALRHAASFSGQSSLKTWVFAILKNRVIDHLRRSRRTVSLSSLAEEGQALDDALDDLFNEQGRWRPEARPAGWQNPESTLADRQFWAAFEICLDRLPPNTGRVFMMREFLGFESDEICSQLQLSTSNLHVILHRARLKLRACLGVAWQGAASC